MRTSACDTPGPHQSGQPPHLGHRSVPRPSRALQTGPRPRVSGAARALSPPYSSALRSRSAFVITETELNVIAALAIIGLSSNPKNG